MPWGEVEAEPEFTAWFAGLSLEHRAAVAYHVDLLAERGALLGEPYTRQLRGKLREQRDGARRRTRAGPASTVQVVGVRLITLPARRRLSNHTKMNGR